MSERAVSTAVSDFVLAGCSYYAAFNVNERSVYAACGFFCVAVAASFGVLKFGVVFPNLQSKVIRLHVLFTWLASVVGKITWDNKEVINTTLPNFKFACIPRKAGGGGWGEGGGGEEAGAGW